MRSTREEPTKLGCKKNLANPTRDAPTYFISCFLKKVNGNIPWKYRRPNKRIKSNDFYSIFLILFWMDLMDLLGRRYFQGIISTVLFCSRIIVFLVASCLLVSHNNLHASRRRSSLAVFAGVGFAPLLAFLTA